MAGETYCYIGNSPLSIPWWTEVLKWQDREGGERVDAPMLFSTMAGAEEELHSLQQAEADEYLRLVENVGEGTVNRALNNTPSSKVFVLDAETLQDNLEDSDFPYVVVDHELKLRQDFVEELKNRLEQQEE